MAGWIKISKDINKHWIWSDPIKLQWWLDILLTVNFEDKKFPIGYRVFECKRGESLMSLLQWSKRWNVSKSVVNNFFTMLENDNMIKTVNETVTTRLTVCNYDNYQQVENTNKTQTKLKQNATETQHDTTKEYIKNNKETNKGVDKSTTPEKILNFKESLYPYVGTYSKEMVKAFFEYWSELNKSKTKMRWELQPTFEISKRLNTWSKKENNFTKQENNVHTI